MILGNFKRDGFVVLKGALSADQTLAPEELSAIHRDLRDTLARSTEAYLERVRLLAKGVAVHRIFCSDAIYEACRSLGVQVPVFISDPVVHVTADDLRIPGGYFGVGAHQDWPALQGSLDAVTVWIPMQHVGIENYPLEFVPGSHKLGLLPSVASEHWSEIDTTGMNFVPVECHRGDALLFSSFAVHRTKTPGHGIRVAYSHRYQNALNGWWREKGYRCAQRRVIDRAISEMPPKEKIEEALGGA